MPNKGAWAKVKASSGKFANNANVPKQKSPRKNPAGGKGKK